MVPMLNSQEKPDKLRVNLTLEVFPYSNEYSFKIAGEEWQKMLTKFVERVLSSEAGVGSSIKVTYERIVQ